MIDQERERERESTLTTLSNREVVAPFFYRTESYQRMTTGNDDEESTTRRKMTPSYFGHRLFRIRKRYKTSKGKKSLTNGSSSVVTATKGDGTTSTSTAAAGTSLLSPKTTKITTAPTPIISNKTQRQPTSRTKVSVVRQRTSWLCRTRHFAKLCDWAFDVVDTDGSGSVDEKELYSGLLLIHLKLGTYAGPAACRPLGREQCHSVFVMMDADNSGCLDREEFRNVMMVLFGNVLLRVLAQWSMTLIIVPLVAQRILDAIYYSYGAIMQFIYNLDERSDLADYIELSFEHGMECIQQQTPPFFLTTWDRMQAVVELIPESVWNTVPLTLLSTILGILVVPWLLFKIDDFFQSLANKRRGQTASAR